MKRSSAHLPELIEFVRDQLQGMGELQARRMFGGWGLYLDELFVALVINDELYVKGDAVSSGLFAAAGATPFCYARRDGRTISVGFWSVPASVLEQADQLQHWLRLGQQAALSARKN